MLKASTYVGMIVFVVFQLLVNQRQIYINNNQIHINKLIMARVGLESVAPRSAKVETKQPLKFAWHQNVNAASWETEWNLVGEDSFVYGVVKKFNFDSTWHVYHGGAGYGEFESKDVAMREAERVANRLGRRTE